MQSLDWVYNASLSLLTENRPMHLRDRKLKTCKLVCMQKWEVGVVRALRASPFTGIYDQRTELILLSHI